MNITDLPLNKSGALRRTVYEAWTRDGKKRALATCNTSAPVRRWAAAKWRVRPSDVIVGSRPDLADWLLPPIERFSDFIHHVRVSLKMHVPDLAARIGISASALSLWSVGRMTPSPENRARAISVCRSLHVCERCVRFR